MVLPIFQINVPCHCSALIHNFLEPDFLPVRPSNRLVELAVENLRAPICRQHHVFQKVTQSLAPNTTADDVADRMSAPARLFIQADTQGGLRYHFMGEEGISGMDPAQPRIAEQSLITS